MIGVRGVGAWGEKKTEELNAEMRGTRRTEAGSGDDMTFI
jgi:hypothetical protein